MGPTGPVGPQGATGPQGPAGAAATVPIASPTVLGAVRVGTGLSIVPGTGLLSTVLPIASPSALGVVRIGTGLAVNSSGVLTGLQITNATAVNCIGFSNSTAGWDDSTNYFDVFPPAGKTMSNLAGFMASLSKVYFAGSVNFDDSLRTQWSVLGDRVRVWVQNSEQRATPAGNYIAFWN